MLFGLNVSQNERHLRENVSCACGLVAGYFHGIITSDVQGMTRISDRTGGAAEGIERSLRYYKLSGICRFNFATCLACNGTNKGGLQYHFGNNCSRSAAHSYVVQMLAQEFPDLIEFDAAKTNKCTFLAPRSEPPAYKHMCGARQNLQSKTRRRVSHGLGTSQRSFRINRMSNVQETI